ncbi:MAG: MFS transporter [Pseudonocardiales bacterium]|nr:MAG: MFS transporter [Pseudonocardiales bacterium]
MRVKAATKFARVRALVGFAAFGSFWGTWGASLPRVQLETGVSDAQLGVALLWVGVGALLSIRWVGGLTDRVERWVLPVSIAALAAAGVVPAFVHGIVVLSAALLLLGVCAGGVDAAINAAAVRAESQGRLVVSLAHGMFSLAVVAGSLGVAALTRAGEGRAWALVVVGVALMAAAVVTATLSVPVARPTVLSDGPGFGWSWPLLILGALAAFAYLVENAWQSWGAIQLHATIGASLQVAALAPAVFALAAASGRFGAHHLASSISAAALFGVSAALAAAGSALAALGHTTAWVLAGIAVAGLGTSVCAPTLITLAGRARYGRQGAATSTVITIAYLGFILGPAAVGLVAGASTLPTALIGVAAVALVLTIASPLLTKLSAP